MLFGSSSKLLLLLSAAVGSAIGAIQLDVKSSAAVDTAGRLASKWLGEYYSTWGDGAWDQNLVQWHESGMYWQTYLQYRKYFGDTQYDNFISSQLIIATYYDQGDFLDGNSGIQATLQGKWNDDIAWWALATLTGAEIWGGDALVNPNGAQGEKGRSWVQISNRTLVQMMEQWEPATCGGGIYWSRDRNSKSKNYKSSISNGQAVQMAARLYSLTKEPYFKTVGDMIYKWMKQYVIKSDYMIIDGIETASDGPTAETCGTITPNPWSYQHGVVIPALAIFYNETKDQTYLDEAHKHFEAAMSFFVDSNNIIYDPICREKYPVCDKDPGGFTWALFRGFATLYTITPDVSIRNRIAAAIEATALDNARNCPGTAADWNCVRTVSPVPDKYTYPNGTNPRDAIETLEILTALAIVRGFAPKENNALPPAPPASVPPVTAGSPNKPSAASQGKTVAAAAYAFCVVLARACGGTPPAKKPDILQPVPSLHDRNDPARVRRLASPSMRSMRSVTGTAEASPLALLVPALVAVDDLAKRKHQQILSSRPQPNLSTPPTLATAGVGGVKKSVRFFEEPKDGGADEKEGKGEVLKDWEEMDDTSMVTFLVEALSLHEKTNLMFQGDSGAYLNIISTLDLSATLTPTNGTSSSSREPGAAKKVTTATLTKWVKSFSAVVSSLSPRLASLVDLLLKVDWIGRGDEFVQVYRHFLENLVSAHAFYMMPVVRMLVGWLRNASDKANLRSSADLSTAFDQIHECLRGVLRLIPSGLSFMIPILTENFPHKTENVQANVWYIRNMMRIAEYAPVLQRPIWGLAIDRAVQIDVEIQTALDDLDEEDYQSVFQHCFDPDALDGEGLEGTVDINGIRKSADNDDNDSEDEHDELDLEDGFESDSDSDDAPPMIVHDFMKMAGKLDSMLNLLMGYVQEALTQPSNPPPTTTRSIRNPRDSFRSMLLEIFERTILPTHKCRYTQFLWFYACSLDATLTDRFLVLLVQKTFDTSSPSILRISASAYLSSFVARASFLDTENVLHIVKMLNGWAVGFVEGNEAESISMGGGPDLKKFGLFYSVVQALLYVFCFRWALIVSGGVEGGAGRFNKGMLPAEMNGFQRVVMSRFAPLKVCSRAVVLEFARITHKLDLLYCYALMQKPNERNAFPPPNPIASSQHLKPPPSAAISYTSHRTPASTSHAFSGSPMSGRSPMSISPTSPSPAATAGDALQAPAGGFLHPTECLEAFFPFDPCHLVLTGKRIEGHYAVWVGEGEEDERSVGASSGVGGESDVEFMSTSLDI
ncbi:hypothetical protein HDU67_010199 [Dinochytrium kinnereticum]|nr:hypothetical protein HDU67_010199 [Dinochytrium kinnereticum]